MTPTGQPVCRSARPPATASGSACCGLMRGAGQRFVVEAEITGGLEHPGVVPVYGLGTYGGGRPYYAMRFIKGDSLKEAIERFHQADHHPSPLPVGEGGRRPGEGPSRDFELRKLLRRFLDVCNAIDYAHSRGVIHRDLKPANIILGQHGETLVVDWGLAKVVGRADPSVGEQTIAPSSSGSSETLPGSALGTPAYMSPEQAGGDLDRLGPRSDVYSLGATLYCLLTGKPPFEGDDIGEILRRVQAGDVRAPREVDPALDKALDAVCQKAMATKPADRYAGCRALAEDIERWAADEPVTAYGEPLSRRARRWAKRNRTIVATAAMALVAGVIGLSAVLVVQTQAKADIARALVRETQARTALAEANTKVQARYELALDAIKTFHTGVSEDFLLKQDQFKELRDRLLRSASDFYGKLSALLDKGTDVASRRALADSNFELAELTNKVGDKEAALAAHRAVLAAREALAAETGADPLVEVDVGRSLTALAGLLRETGKTDEALAACRRSESLLAGLAGTDPAARAALAECRSKLGSLQSSTGHSSLALAAYKQARVDQEELAAVPGAPAATRRDLADTVQSIAVLLSETGSHAAAEAEFRTALAIQQKLADDSPAIAQFRSGLAYSHSRLARAFFYMGKPSEAEAECRTAVAIGEKLADANPGVTEFRSQLALSHNNLGAVLYHRGKPREAEAEFSTAVGIEQKLADDNPAVTRFRLRLAASHGNLGNVLQGTGKQAEAEAEYRTAVAIGEKLADANPGVTEFRNFLALGHNNLGNLLSSRGKPAEAEAEYRTAMAIEQKLADDHPAVTEFRVLLATSHNMLGLLLARQKRFPEAFTGLEAGLAIRQKLVDADPKNFVYTSPLGWSYAYRGGARVLAGQPALAAADLRRARELWAKLPKSDVETRFEQARALALLAGLGQDAKSGVTAAEAAAFADQAVATLRDAIGAGWARRAELKESEFDPLRGREDFRKLLAELEVKVGTKAKPKD
jgi:tetratricopeptide (TPR) repeat protein